jgi:predicted RNA-binding Zn ribbon-like protein
MTTNETPTPKPPDGARQPALHAHAADLEACLDFINSEELTAGIPEEHMPTVDVAVAYFVERGLAHEGVLRAQAARDGDAWLRRLHATRAALRAAWDAQVEGRTPPADAFAVLNDVLRHAGSVELRAGLTGIAVGHRHVDDDPTGEALARIVQPLVDAIAAGETSRFRVCANDGCRWVFEDTSRAGRRRWCDMTTCGNRAKVRRFRSKRRGATDARPRLARDEGQARSSSGRTSVAKRVIDSSS